MLFLSSIEGCSLKTLEIKGLSGGPVTYGRINKIVYCLDTLQIKGLIVRSTCSRGALTSNCESGGGCGAGNPTNKFISVSKCKSEVLEKCKNLGIKVSSYPNKMVSKKELKTQCKERGIKGYSNKKKEELIKLLSSGPVSGAVRSTTDGKVPAEKIYRLNYIGSKFQLLDWIEEQIKEKTGWASFKDKVVGDLFSGTGIVSYHFRKKEAITVSNDAELYSSIITHAFALSDYNDTCKSFIEKIQKELDEGKNKVGYITRNYSPYEDCERMFFTVENAMKIDYISQRISAETNFSDNDYKFVLASLLLSADNVSNVPAVYGCYLKNFKAKATKPLKLEPIHTNKIKCKDGSVVYNKDVVSSAPENKKLNLVYLDPPYNERQYSKNYFPLNMIALSPEEQKKQPPLKGKTGIPENCFLSPFCKKGQVENAFDTIFSNINTEWLFMSYNSESIVSKERLIDIMKKYGEVSVIEKDYKRFKSFEYNEDTDIKEYLFCLKKNHLEE